MQVPNLPKGEEIFRKKGEVGSEKGKNLDIVKGLRFSPRNSVSFNLRNIHFFFLHPYLTFDSKQKYGLQVKQMISSKIKILKLDFRVIFFYLQAISILKPDIWNARSRVISCRANRDTKVIRYRCGHGSNTLNKQHGPFLEVVYYGIAATLDIHRPCLAIKTRFSSYFMFSTE